jgi:tetratricopeptide (TPR) repeat protein
MTHRTLMRAGRLLTAAILMAAPLPAAERSTERSLEGQVAAAEASYDRAQVQLVIDQLAALVDRDPENAAYRYLLARALFPQVDLFDWAGQPERAREAGRQGIAHLERSLQLGGGANPDTYRLLGDFYGRLRFLEGVFGRLRYGGRSAKYHELALQRTPEDPRALIGYATDKLHAPPAFGGDPGAAVALLEKALSIDPGAVRGHVCLAKAYLKRGETDRARAAFEKARALAPKSGFVRGEWEIVSREHNAWKTATTASAR